MSAVQLVNRVFVFSTISYNLRYFRFSSLLISSSISDRAVLCSFRNLSNIFVSTLKGYGIFLCSNGNIYRIFYITEYLYDYGIFKTAF